MCIHSWLQADIPTRPELGTLASLYYVSEDYLKLIRYRHLRMRRVKKFDLRSQQLKSAYCTWSDIKWLQQNNPTPGGWV